MHRGSNPNLLDLDSENLAQALSNTLKVREELLQKKIESIASLFGQLQQENMRLQDELASQASEFRKQQAEIERLRDERLRHALLAETQAEEARRALFGLHRELHISQKAVEDRKQALATLNSENQRLSADIQERDTRINQLLTVHQTAQQSNLTVEKKRPTETKEANWDVLKKIINDTAYWRTKSTWSTKPPDGVLDMQKLLRTNADSFDQIRKVGWNKYKSKDWIYLFFAYNNRNPMTESLYKIFTEISSSEAIGESNSFKTLKSDWEKFNTPKPRYMLSAL